MSLLENDDLSLYAYKKLQETKFTERSIRFLYRKKDIFFNATINNFNDFQI